MATFGLKYYGEFSSKHFGIRWRVEIEERDYDGSREQLVFDGVSPVKVTWEQRGDEFYAPVKASEATVAIVCRENFHYLPLFTADPRKYRLSILRDGSLYWRGYLTADLYSESFAAPPYTVTLKATDGFSLLGSVPFYDYATYGTSGRYSLFTLMRHCLLELELDMPITDWLDLRTPNMTDGVSPLAQTFIDLERLFYVYDNPTLLDVLEICLRPFAAQVFQGSGALHVRRAASLYGNARPASFYTIGTSLPEGYGDRPCVLRLARRISTLKNRAVDGGELRVVREKKRPERDLLWDGHIYATDRMNLEIEPAVREVNVTMRNRSYDDFVASFGFFDASRWNDPNGLMTFGIGKEGAYFRLEGSTAHLSEVYSCEPTHIEQCNFAFRWEFTIKGGYTAYTPNSMSGSSVSSHQQVTLTVTYGMKIVSGSTTHWLTAGGSWTTTQTNISTEVKSGDDTSVKIDIDGIPVSGDLVFYVVESLTGSISEYMSRGQRVRSGHISYATFCLMTLSVDTGDSYTLGLETKAQLNPANNAVMNIELPVADIPATPNDLLIYSFFFTDRNGYPTRLWHADGSEYYDTLVGHIVHTALLFRQLPSRRLTGEIFTRLHLDLNSVIVDGKYLHAGFMVNSLEVDALEDSCDAELCELPRLLEAEVADEDSNYMRIASLPITVEGALRSGNTIYLWNENKDTYAFDTISRTVRPIYLLDDDGRDCAVYPAQGGGIVRHEGSRLYYIDSKGKVLDSFQLGNAIILWATYRDGRFWTLTLSSTGQNLVMKYASGENVSYTTPSGRTRIPTDMGNGTSWLSGELVSVVASENTVIVNTSQYIYLHDRRYHGACLFSVLQGFSPWDFISAIGDDYFLAFRNSEDVSWLYRRTSILEYSREEFYQSSWIMASDISSTQVAHIGDHPQITTIPSRREYYTYCGDFMEEDYKAVFLVYGDAYLVLGRSIHKFIPESCTEDQIWQD